MNKKRVGVVFLILAIAIGGWLWLSGPFGDAKLQALKDEDIKELMNLHVAIHRIINSPNFENNYCTD